LRLNRVEALTMRDRARSSVSPPRHGVARRRANLLTRSFIPAMPNGRACSIGCTCICQRRLNAALSWPQQTASESGQELPQELGIFSLALPDNERSPAELAQGALLDLVPAGVSFELGDPPFAPVRWCGAVLAAAMAMPEAAVDEDDRFVFRENDIRLSRKGFYMETKAEAHPM